MDWKGMLDLDVMSLSNTSGISTLSRVVSIRQFHSWVAPLVVPQWLVEACCAATRMRFESNLLRAAPIEVPQHKFGHWTVKRFQMHFNFCHLGKRRLCNSGLQRFLKYSYSFFQPA